MTSVCHPDACQTCHGLDTVEGGLDCPDKSWCPSMVTRGTGTFTCGQPRGHEGNHRTGAVEWAYDAARVKTELDPHRERFEALLRVGQMPTWSCDQRTKDLWCLGKWLSEQFAVLPDEQRIQYQWYFNRKVRAEDQPFEVAAMVMNKHLMGEAIEDVYTRYSTDRGKR